LIRGRSVNSEARIDLSLNFFPNGLSLSLVAGIEADLSRGLLFLVLFSSSSLKPIPDDISASIVPILQKMVDKIS